MSTLRTVLVSALCVATCVKPGLLSGQSTEAAASRASGIATVVGCYDVVEGAWEPHSDRRWGRTPVSPPESQDSAQYQIPPRIRIIESDDPRAFSGMGLVQVPEGALPTPHLYSSWSLSRDTLQLGLTSGFSGVVASLVRDGDDWAGVARTSSDGFGRDEPVQGYVRYVSLRVVDCATPPPVSDSGVRPLPRSVELAGGGSIELGSTPPPGYETVERASSAWTLRAEATGLFAGADTIILLPHFRTDIVAGIEMKFMTVTSEELRDRLADVIGELRTATRGGQIVSYIATSRTTRIMITPGTSTGFVRLRITDRRLY